MVSESSISGVPSKFHGLKILLVDNDTTSLSNIATALEQHSFRVMSSTMKREMVEKAREQGAYFILLKPISTKKLKNVWQYVYRHQIEASQKQKHKANDTVEVMDNKSCADKKIHDRKGKSIVNPSENYQEVGSLLEKDDAEGLMRMKIVDEESRELGKEDHFLVSKNTTEGRGKKRQCMKWTPDLEGSRSQLRHIPELMNEPNLTKSQVTNHIQLYSSQKRQVQPTIISSIDNQSKIMSQTAPPLVLGNHSSALNSKKLPMNFSEPVQEAVPLNDIFTGLNGCNQDPELGHFNVLNPDEFPMNEPVQEAVPPNDFFTGLSGCNQDPELDYFNILNSNEFPMSFNEEFQEVYLPQPPAVPSLVPPNDFFAGLDGLI
ncbi:Trans-acting T-cell-specific transcription factor GATA-3 [Datura stramonium]|uniref:Trans-acting T-cell-specific transcription factor GATA-3 n=1 Tax=Datura stramonium TaxID=4076 RepID=A0ABS8V963_DATST|nr:Trans-acting T-cell-specific transcription factor GATA-3 [Datura stramonium]